MEHYQLYEIYYNIFITEITAPKCIIKSFFAERHYTLCIQYNHGA